MRAPLNKKFKTRQCLRREIGSLGVVLLSCMFLIVIALGVIAVDVAHVQTVLCELQSACDAAALAGAQDYANNSAMADVDALNVASYNTADGRSVAPSSTCTVSVNLTPPDDPQQDDPAQVIVTASMKIRHLLAPIFGRVSDWLETKSSAVYYPSINQLGPNQVFPISPSLTDPSQGPPIGGLPIGSPVTITIQPSGGNACWTSGSLVHPSTPVIQAAANVALGLSARDSSADPAVVADGTSQIALTQGLHNGVDLSQPPYSTAILQKPFLVMPCITGSNPYNQSRVVQGFICVNVSSIASGHDSITLQGTLVKGVVDGFGGEPPNGGTPEGLSASAVQLGTPPND